MSGGTLNHYYRDNLIQRSSIATLGGWSAAWPSPSCSSSHGLCTLVMTQSGVSRHASSSVSVKVAGAPLSGQRGRGRAARSPKPDILARHARVGGRGAWTTPRRSKACGDHRQAEPKAPSGSALPRLPLHHICCLATATSADVALTVWSTTTTCNGCCLALKAPRLDPGGIICRAPRTHHARRGRGQHGHNRAASTSSTAGQAYQVRSASTKAPHGWAAMLDHRHRAQ